LSHEGDQYLIDWYQRFVDELTEKRNELQALAEAAEAEISRIDREQAEIWDFVLIDGNETPRKDWPLVFGSDYRQDQLERFVAIGEERVRLQRRATAWRREIEPLDRGIDLLNEEIKRLKARSGS
jgi:hypothetical protein